VFVITNNKRGRKQKKCVLFLRAPSWGLACSAIGSAAIAGSDFPQREITFIVPWNAGGSNDVLARGLQPLLREQGFNIVIENITGLGGFALENALMRFLCTKIRRGSRTGRLQRTSRHTAGRSCKRTPISCRTDGKYLAVLEAFESELES
jgi:hypothetical protein